jgi:NTE family protein
MVNDKLPTVVIGCQGGGMHAAFEVGVLTKILEEIAKPKPKFKLVGLSGTSAGALCALMVWYGLAPKKAKSGRGSSGSAREAIDTLNHFWEDFIARTRSETLLNLLTFGTFRAEESEVPLLGISTGALGLNPRSALYKAIAAWLPEVGVRRAYFDLVHLLTEACPDFENIDWANVKTRLLIGAAEVVKGYETVFDSELKKNHEEITSWHQRLPLSLEGVAASGTLPAFREAQHIKGHGYYWDGLYSQNPPVREFVEDRTKAPDELWILRINPQEWPYAPETHGEIRDRENELMGNLSLHKELDFIRKVNDWRDAIENFLGAKGFADITMAVGALTYKKVVVRTIKMRKETVDELQFSSKFDRSFDFMDRLRREGREVAEEWLADWPNVGRYPEDAGYSPPVLGASVTT